MEKEPNDYHASPRLVTNKGIPQNLGQLACTKWKVSTFSSQCSDALLDQIKDQLLSNNKYIMGPTPHDKIY